MNNEIIINYRREKKFRTSKLFKSRHFSNVEDEIKTTVLVPRHSSAVYVLVAVLVLSWGARRWRHRRSRRTLARPRLPPGWATPCWARAALRTAGRGAGPPHLATRRTGAARLCPGAGPAGQIATSGGAIFNWGSRVWGVIGTCYCEFVHPIIIIILK